MIRNVWKEAGLGDEKWGGEGGEKMIKEGVRNWEATRMKQVMKRDGRSS